MKKVVSLLAVLFLFAGLSFATVSTTTYTGVADFRGYGEFYFDFTLKNVSNDKEADTLRWSASKSTFVSGSTVSWVMADQYAVLESSISSKANCFVYIYQTNTKSTTYVATSSRTSSDGGTPESATGVFSGLVNTRTNGGEYQGYVPVAYSINKNENKTMTFDGNAQIVKDGSGNIIRQDRFLTDAADKYTKTENGHNAGDSSFKKSYGMIGAGTGVGVVYGVDDKTGPYGREGKSYMYFFGGFSNIISGDEYGTDQIHIEKHIE